MEPNSPKKIQFAVPLFQSHLDPQAAEHIRKRRPTPATLVIYNDPNASDDKQSTSSSQAENQSAQLSPAQRKTSVYTPPTMRGRDQSDTQRSNQEESLHPQKLLPPHLATLSEEPGDAPPRRKDTPYQQEAPFTTGVRMMKGQMESSSAFQEEEESSGEKREKQAE